MKIYHNPRCRKSRESLALLEEHGVQAKVVEYLKTPVQADELKQIISMLGISAEALIRKGESIYKETFKGKTLTEDEWINVMVEHPKLMERPIVVNEGKAVIGRPPEKVLTLL
jgi:arsenate reductase